MKPYGNGKHQQSVPNVRTVRRTCSKELYRTIKKLKMRIPPDQVTKAEQLYFKNVVLNLQWITENGSNRKRLADWWEEHVCPDIAELWNVDREKLAMAFRQAFGG